MDSLSFGVEADPDDNFFSKLHNRSNLGELFGVETSRPHEQQTLRYQAPKQAQTSNIKQSTVAANTLNWITQLAKVATAYCAGEPVGKVGVAILSNTAGDCRLIAYKTKKQILATFSLRAGDTEGRLHRQEGYIQFYADDGTYWSARFDKETDEQEFLQKLQENHVTVHQELAKKEQNVTPLKEQSRAIADEPKAPTTTTINSDKKDNSLPVTPKPTHSKTQIISRMAKMGGQQLPKFTSNAQTTEYSDSSDAEVIATSSSLSSKPAIVPRNSKLPTKTQILTTKVVPGNSVSVYEAPNLALATANAMETQFLQMLLTENRTQNTEMRMNMGKLEGKIEKVLDKIEFLKLDDGKQRTDKDDEILELEEKLLELKKENRKLKQAMEGKERGNEGKTLRNILELYEQELEALNVVSAESLETLINMLLEKCAALNLKLQKNENELAQSTKELNMQKEKCKEASEKNLKSTEEHKALEKETVTLQSRLLSLQKDKEDLEHKLVTQAQSHAEQLKQRELTTTDTVKTIMNALYGNLVGKIEGLEHLQHNEVLTVIGRTIKEETLKAIGTTKP